VIFIPEQSSVRQRGTLVGGVGYETVDGGSIAVDSQSRGYSAVTWKRIFLLIVAITIHNVPGPCVEKPTVGR